MKVFALFALVAVAHAGVVQVAQPVATALVETGVSTQTRTQDNLGNYAFAYDEGHTTGGTFRKEVGDSFGNKVGSYGLIDADGRQRIVNYVADAAGFRADIKSNEPGVGATAEDPASTTINKQAVVLGAPAQVVTKSIHAPAVLTEVASAPVLAATKSIHAAPVAVAQAAHIEVAQAPAAVTTHHVTHHVAAAPSVAYASPAASLAYNNLLGHTVTHQVSGPITQVLSHSAPATQIVSHSAPLVQHAAVQQVAVAQPLVQEVAAAPAQVVQHVQQVAAPVVTKSLHAAPAQVVQHVQHVQHVQQVAPVHHVQHVQQVAAPVVTKSIHAAPAQIAVAQAPAQVVQHVQHVQHLQQVAPVQHVQQVQQVQHVQQVAPVQHVQEISPVVGKSIHAAPAQIAVAQAPTQVVHQQLAHPFQSLSYSSYTSPHSTLAYSAYSNPGVKIAHGPAAYGYGVGPVAYAPSPMGYLTGPLSYAHTPLAYGVNPIPIAAQQVGVKSIHSGLRYI